MSVPSKRKSKPHRLHVQASLRIFADDLIDTTFSLTVFWKGRL